MNKKKKYHGRTKHSLLRILTILLMLVAIPQRMWSQITTYQGVELTKPKKYNDVYYIYNRGELLWWAVNSVNSIKLMADINMQGDKQLLKADGKTLALDEKDIVVWPKARIDRYKYIYGNNHTIYGIYQKRGYGTSKERGAIRAYDYVGLIPLNESNVSISDLTIADSYLEGKYAGGFIGCEDKSPQDYLISLSNCKFKGYIKGDVYAGGLCGWYRMDGQDVEVKRFINYGTIEAGQPGNANKDTGAGGLIGYLDIARTNFFKSHTMFDRCVNYGNVTNLSPCGSVGGIVGKVWDNNNGRRKWQFCFNFGNVKKYDFSNKPLAGSGLMGNYININKAQAKLIGCGNAKKSDTGTLIDSITTSSKDKVAFVASGSKTILSSKVYSSIQEDDSWTAWWNNHWGTVAIVTGVLLVAIATAGIGAAVGSAAASQVAAAASVIQSTFYAGTAIVSPAVIAAEAALAAVYIKTFGILVGGIVAATTLGTIAESYDYFRSDHNGPVLMLQTDLPYTEADVKAGRFAYDANLMMTADKIDGSENKDKTILFGQHIDANDAAKSDSVPTVYNINGTSNKLYYGYDGCHRIPTINNDPSLLAVPAAHRYDSHGECTYCHMKQQALGIVYKDDNQTVDYYTIENEAQLNYLANAFNGDNDEAYKLYKNATFKLIADINYTDGFIWSPIGSTTENYQKTSSQGAGNWHHFEGNFDGQGHTIKGLVTSEYVNYAGLFGSVECGENNASISNVHLSNCSFSGNVAGTIAGEIIVDDNDFMRGVNTIDRVCADSSVLVIATCKDNQSYAGGFLGKITGDTDQENDLTISFSYSNATILIKRTQTDINPAKILGCYVGAAEEKGLSNAIKIFKHCYFGGESLYAQNTIANFGEKASQNAFDFEDSYSIGTSEPEKKVDAKHTPLYVARNYMTSGRLAYDLMNNSKLTKDGETTYFYAQKGNYPVLTNTKQPTLCKVKVVDMYTLTQLADTLVNTNEAKWSVPLEYAGRTFDTVQLYGWDNEKLTGSPSYKGVENDLSELYNTPGRYYRLYLMTEQVPALATINNEAEWKGAGVLGGYQKTTLASDLYLIGSNSWALEAAPQCIDGNNKTVRAGLPLINNTNETISAARKIFRSRSRGTRAGGLSDDVTLQNMRVQASVLTQDVLSKGGRKLYLKNMILQSINGEKTILDWNTETKSENNEGYDFNNVICQNMDSTSVAFYKNGSDVMTTTFSDADKKNDYEHILGYMLAQDGMLDAFGLRLSGKNEKVAGKLGFSDEEDKHIYRVTLYNQSTGLEDGEVLMNYDGDVTFDVKGNKLGAMHEGLPDGTFAVLPLTKEELGENFSKLGKNIITKDGQAACIRLEDGKTDGFAYPSCFDADKNLILTAMRTEYVRNVHRDGLHESIYLPFAFNSVEFDENDINDDDQLEISFLGFSEKDGLTENGKSINLTSLRSYYTQKYNDGNTPSQDVDSTDIFKLAFFAGIPYMITLKCAERADEMSTITFVGGNGEYGIGFLRKESPVDPTDPCAPLYGLFHTKTAGEVANGMKIFGLDVFTDEATGNLYDKFVRAKDTDRLDAFRCFIATNSSLVGDDIGILVDKGTTTGIKDVKFSDLQKNGRIFDLSGRRVTKKTPRNIYIQNGKKVVAF